MLETGPMLCVRKNILPSGTMKIFTVCSQYDLLEFTALGWLHSLRY